MNWITWLFLVIGLIVGILGGFALGVWYLRRSVTNTQMDDKEIMQMAKRMGMNLSPRQLQMVKQQMKKGDGLKKNDTAKNSPIGKLGNFGKKKEGKTSSVTSKKR